MTVPLPIPDSDRDLVDLLRRAVHGSPADPASRQLDWPGLLRRSQEHGVAAFLYPWLAGQMPGLFAPGVPASEESAPAAWRALFLRSLSRSVLRRKQLAQLLGEFEGAGLDVVPLKGAWLSEAVYDDPAQRTMSDLDLLVRREDRDAAHARLLACGYTSGQDTLHNPYSRDQSYRHPSYPYAIELHWDFFSQMSDAVPPPDLAAIWSHTGAASCCGRRVRQLPAEDVVALLAHHLLGHLFALPLRAHLDLALLLKKAGGRLSPQALESASGRWKTGGGAPFLIRFTAGLFDLTLPPELEAWAEDPDPARLAQACQAVFSIPPARARDGEQTWLKLKRASLPGRLRLVASRVFMPQAFLQLRYPCARTRIGLPLAWLLRACDLCRGRPGWTTALLSGGSSGDGRLASAENREALVRWLLSKTDGPA